LSVSNNYQSIEDSFNDASKNTDKVDYAKFSAFVSKNESLRGFNMTE
jgi:hypothetical protein